MREQRDKLIEYINNIPDLRNTDLSVKLLLNPDKKHASVIREAVFKFIRDTNYQSHALSDSHTTFEIGSTFSAGCIRWAKMKDRLTDPAWNDLKSVEGP